MSNNIFFVCVESSTLIDIVSLLSQLHSRVNMASQCSLSTLFPIQSQLDCALDEATSQQEKENLIYQYLKKLEDREYLKIPDFQPGESTL